MSSEEIVMNFFSEALKNKRNTDKEIGEIYRGIIKGFPNCSIQAMLNLLKLHRNNLFLEIQGRALAKYTTKGF